MMKKFIATFFLLSKLLLAVNAQVTVFKIIDINASTGLQYRLPIWIYNFPTKQGQFIFEDPVNSFAGTRAIFNISLNNKSLLDEIGFTTTIGYRFINYLTPTHDTTRQLWLVNPGEKRLSLDLGVYYTHKIMTNEVNKVSFSIGTTYHNFGSRFNTYYKLPSSPGIQTVQMSQELFSLYAGVGYSWYDRFTIQIGNYYSNSKISSLGFIVFFLPHVDIKYTFFLKKDKEPEPGINLKGL